MNRRYLILVLVTGFSLALVPSGSGPVAVTETTPNNVGTPSDSDIDSSCWSAADRSPQGTLGLLNQQQWIKPPEMLIDPTGAYTATMNTSEGTFKIQLLPEIAPITVNNFVCLAWAGYYDGTSFHRIVAGFVIQGGDPTGSGSGGPGYRFDDEPVAGDYVRGAVAMANAGPNTNGSQFFVVLDDLQGQLARNYTIFGQVSEGLEVVEALGQVPTTTNARGEKSVPLEPVTLESVIIEGTIQTIAEAAESRLTATVQAELTATAEAQATASAIAVESARVEFLGAVGSRLKESPDLPSGLEFHEAERVLDAVVVPADWEWGATYPVSILGNSDDTWVSLLAFESSNEAGASYADVTGGLLRSGWQEQDADGLGHDHLCLTLVLNESSQSVCYLLRDDAIVMFYSYIRAVAPDATLLNAIDLARLANDAYDSVDRPQE